ncbi:YwiC-like family protein [Bacillus shivajii]|uniref:YwiC-like family protein n=1 Tax=Bacillus shivajii TaxID=1983719 RepID=UPI001CFBDF3A|nr:YwiC-like family protein [Bacillus shivajii]UCZ51975.1 YwiC-like family protein [Bacillus shivajii]
MKWYIPREHGAWAMLIVPYWIGAAISGINWFHAIFFIGVFSLYFAQGPLLTFVRNSKHKDVWPVFSIYTVVGFLFTVPFLFMEPMILLIGIMIIPLFSLNVYFAKTKRERLFINDVIAIIALSLLLLVAYQLGAGMIDLGAIIHFHWVVLFFISSVFHVKSLIREKKNVTFHKFSKVFHVAIIIYAMIFHWYAAALAFSVSALKTYFVPKEKLKKPMQIGIVEIINSVIFFIIIVISYYLI